MIEDSTPPRPKKTKRQRLLLRLARQARREEALGMLRSGKSSADVAEVMGVSKATVQKWVSLELKASHEHTKAHVEEITELNVQRCEELIAALWPNKSAARTTEILLKVMERQSKYLGLDKPIQVEHTVHVDQMTHQELREEALRIGLSVEEAEYRLLSTPQELPGLPMPTPPAAFTEVIPAEPSILLTPQEDKEDDPQQYAGCPD